jgi:hypothetical protein
MLNKIIVQKHTIIISNKIIVQKHTIIISNKIIEKQILYKNTI